MLDLGAQWFTLEQLQQSSRHGPRSTTMHCGIDDRGQENSYGVRNQQSPSQGSVISGISPEERLFQSGTPECSEHPRNFQRVQSN